MKELGICGATVKTFEPNNLENDPKFVLWLDQKSAKYYSYKAESLTVTSEFYAHSRWVIETSHSWVGLSETV